MVVPAPAVESVVASWGTRLDIAAAQGMPAHITVLYPFLPESRLVDAVLVQLRAVCAERGPFVVGTTERTPVCSQFPMPNGEREPGARRPETRVARGCGRSVKWS